MPRVDRARHLCKRARRLEWLGLHISSFGGLKDRLRGIFADREFFMRSEGEVRFITIAARTQMIAAGIAAAMVLAFVTAVTTAVWTQSTAARERLALAQRASHVATAEHRLAAYRQDMDAVADDLSRRQDIIEEMVDSLPADAKGDFEDGGDSAATDASGAVAKISTVLPEAATLSRLEARQFAFVGRLTRFADGRSARAASAIRKLGLDPDAMVRRAPRSGMGGPVRKLVTSRDGTVDPRFQRLGRSLARMDALERGLDGIPQVLPASIEMISSGFGYRSDPFTGIGAMHSGLDFRGPVGAPIHAAAAGKVSFVGQQNGYGNVIEVSHGNGLMTRYAHMSHFAAVAGQTVAAGDVIGAIGSTGRSTGPHLHFEVRINGRAVNPRPFLDVAPGILAQARDMAAHG